MFLYFHCKFYEYTINIPENITGMQILAYKVTVQSRYNQIS